MTAFGIGLLGGAHCIGMCGGVMGALVMAIEPKQTTYRFLLVLSYNVGRIMSYVVIAVIFYLLIHQVQHYYWLSFLRVLAGLMLIAMGLYLANWWRGLTHLEKLGSHLWKPIQPFSQSLLPVKSIKQALLLGAIWGWLPCGLIYSALAYSLTANNIYQAASIMLFFALGTLPAVMFSSLLAERLIAVIKKNIIRQFFAILIIAFGLWTLIIAISHGGHHHDMGNDHKHSSLQMTQEDDQRV